MKEKKNGKTRVTAGDNLTTPGFFVHWGVSARLVGAAILDVD